MQALKTFCIGSAFIGVFAGVSEMLKKQKELALKLRDEQFFDKIEEVTEEAHKYMNLSHITLEDTNKIAKAIKEFENSPMYNKFSKVGRHDYTYSSPAYDKYYEFTHLANVINSVKLQHIDLSTFTFNFKPIRTPQELVDFIDTYHKMSLVLHRHAYQNNDIESDASTIISKTDKYALVKEQFEKHKNMYNSNIVKDYYLCVWNNSTINDAVHLKCAEDALRTEKLA